MITAEDRQKIEEGIRQKYTKVAISPEGNFQYPTGEALKEVLRVLRPLGRFMIADQVLTVKPPEDPRSMVESWAR